MPKPWPGQRRAIAVLQRVVDELGTEVICATTRAATHEAAAPPPSTGRSRRPWRTPLDAAM